VLSASRRAELHDEALHAVVTACLTAHRRREQETE